MIILKRSPRSVPPLAMTVRLSEAAPSPSERAGVRPKKTRTFQHGFMIYYKHYNLCKHGYRVLNVLFKRLQELCPCSAINSTVIAR